MENYLSLRYDLKTFLIGKRKTRKNSSMHLVISYKGDFNTKKH